MYDRVAETPESVPDGDGDRPGDRPEAAPLVLTALGGRARPAAPAPAAASGD
ncbi:hypothetical protein R2F25_13520 [Streptomyces sp. UP1A-1]|nr:hypothetical protein [Streptomyces sp. UP1A-1]